MPKIYFIGAGPGDPELITVKGLHLIENADVLLYAGSLVNPLLIQRSHASVKVNSYGMKLEDQIELLVKHAESGKIVVRLHSGDPSLYGAISEQIIELEKRGLRVEIIPGVSSLFGAAAALKVELTPKGVSESVIITRPAGNTLDKDYIRELSRLGFTMAIFLGSSHLDEIQKSLDYPPDTPAAIVYHATWGDELCIRGTVSDIVEKAHEAGIERSALLLIGNAVDSQRKGVIRSHLYS
ncbi:MAG: precorrin-4 C(11)-methyltransferase [Methanolinea sp.]|jgi:precorrin-4/cobalt-precorrin-4 C11-methyltransferase|nr:precorrin-4 C(11)-methyltransferase [Methanolinea sp.]